jgi:Uma2 family endonuclease
MVQNPTKRMATYADLEDIPRNKIGEILDGDLVVSPLLGSLQARAKTRLGGMLAAFSMQREGPDAWVILFAPELHLSGDALVPDIVGWRRERMPVIPDAPAFSMAPDWVCEVVSPATVSLDRGPKMRAYARERVPHLWLVEPLLRTLEVYRLAEDEHFQLQRVFEASAIVRAEPFEALPLKLDALWER